MGTSKSDPSSEQTPFRHWGRGVPAKVVAMSLCRGAAGWETGEKTARDAQGGLELESWAGRGFLLLHEGGSPVRGAPGQPMMLLQPVHLFSVLGRRGWRAGMVFGV